MPIYRDKMNTFGFLQPGAKQPREEIFDPFQNKGRGLSNRSLEIHNQEFFNISKSKKNLDMAITCWFL
jgi:hypothetical protein